MIDIANHQQITVMCMYSFLSVYLEISHDIQSNAISFSLKYNSFGNIWHTFNSDHVETALHRKIKQKTAILSVPKVIISNNQSTTSHYETIKQPIIYHKIYIIM